MVAFDHASSSSLPSILIGPGVRDFIGRQQQSLPLGRKIQQTTYADPYEEHFIVPAHFETPAFSLFRK
jgi:hypothetical protein